MIGAFSFPSGSSEPGKVSISDGSKHYASADKIESQSQRYWPGPVGHTSTATLSVREKFLPVKDYLQPVANFYRL